MQKKKQADKKLKLMRERVRELSSPDVSNSSGGCNCGSLLCHVHSNAERPNAE